MPLINTDRFAITRDGVTRRVSFLQIREHMGSGVAQVDRLEDDDWFILNRDGTDHRVRWSVIQSAVEGTATNIDDDDFFVVGRLGNNFRYNFSAFSTQLQGNPRPWEEDVASGWANGIVHITGLTQQEVTRMHEWEWDNPSVPPIRVYTIIGEQVEPVVDPNDTQYHTWTYEPNVEYIISINTSAYGRYISGYRLFIDWQSAFEFGILTNTTEMTIFNGLLEDAVNFNSPTINRIDVSNALSLTRFFGGATNFNQPLDSWDVSNVILMDVLFYEASAFNQDISSWDTSSVMDMSAMFWRAHAFNQPLNGWDVSGVFDFGQMFDNAQSFNQPLDAWRPLEGVSFNRMFKDTPVFLQDISNWCVPNAPPDTIAFQNSAMEARPDFHPVWGTCPSGELASAGHWRLSGTIDTDRVNQCQEWIPSSYEVPPGGRRELVIRREHGGVAFSGNGNGQTLINHGASTDRAIYLHRTDDQVRVSYNGREQNQYPGGIAGMSLIYEVNLGYYRINGRQFLREGGWAKFRFDVDGRQNEYVFDIQLRCESQDLPNVELLPGLNLPASCDLTAQEMWLCGLYVKAGNGKFYAMNIAECKFSGATTITQTMEQATQCVPLTPGVIRVQAHEDIYDANNNRVRLGGSRTYELTCEAYKSLG